MRSLRLSFAFLLLASCTGAIVQDRAPAPDSGTPPATDASAGNVESHDGSVPTPPMMATCARNAAPPARAAANVLAATSAPDGRIYVAMGTPGAGAPQVAAYDPASNTWTPLPDLPSVSGYLYVSAAATASALYFVEIVGNDPFTPHLFAYDSASKTWTPRADFHFQNFDAGVPTTGSEALLLAHGSSLFLTGAYTTALFEYEEPTNDWWLRAFPPVAFDGAAVSMTADGHIIATGMQNAVYDVASATWSRIPDSIVPRYYATSALDARGQLHTFGGYCGSGGNNQLCANDHEAFDLATSAWSTAPRLPFATDTSGSAASAALGCDGRIYLFGADIGTQRFDPDTQTWDWSK